MSNVMKEIIDWVKTIILAFAIAMIINYFGGIAIVEGSSMVPTLHHKDILLMNKFIYKYKSPQFGDIIAFKSNIPLNNKSIYNFRSKNKVLVKRIIGVPGDNIRVTNGEVYVNDKKLKEAYLNNGTTNGEYQGTVPQNHYFVMGDNRLKSNDSRSREVGFVGRETIIGKIFFRVLPIGNIRLFK